MDFLKKNFPQLVDATSEEFAEFLNGVSLDGIDGTWVATKNHGKVLLDAVVTSNGNTYCLQLKNNPVEFFELWQLKGSMYAQIPMNQRWIIALYDACR